MNESPNEEKLPKKLENVASTSTKNFSEKETKEQNRGQIKPEKAKACKQLMYDDETYVIKSGAIKKIIDPWESQENNQKSLKTYSFSVENFKCGKSNIDDKHLSSIPKDFNSDEKIILGVWFRITEILKYLFNKQEGNIGLDIFEEKVKNQIAEIFIFIEIENKIKNDIKYDQKSSKFVIARSETLDDLLNQFLIIINIMNKYLSRTESMVQHSEENSQWVLFTKKIEKITLGMRQINTKQFLKMYQRFTEWEDFFFSVFNALFNYVDKKFEPSEVNCDKKFFESFTVTIIYHYIKILVEKITKRNIIDENMCNDIERTQYLTKNMKSLEVSQGAEMKNNQEAPEKKSLNDMVLTLINKLDHSLHYTLCIKYFLSQIETLIKLIKYEVNPHEKLSKYIPEFSNARYLTCINDIEPCVDVSAGFWGMIEILWDTIPDITQIDENLTTYEDSCVERIIRIIEKRFKFLKDVEIEESNNTHTIKETEQKINYELKREILFMVKEIIWQTLKIVYTYLILNEKEAGVHLKDSKCLNSEILSDEFKENPQLLRQKLNYFFAYNKIKTNIQTYIKMQKENFTSDFKSKTSINIKKDKPAIPKTDSKKYFFFDYNVTKTIICLITKIIVIIISDINKRKSWRKDGPMLNENLERNRSKDAEDIQLENLNTTLKKNPTKIGINIDKESAKQICKEIKMFVTKIIEALRTKNVQPPEDDRAFCDTYKPKKDIYLETLYTYFKQIPPVKDTQSALVVCEDIKQILSHIKDILKTQETELPMDKQKHLDVKDAKLGILHIIFEKSHTKDTMPAKSKDEIIKEVLEKVEREKVELMKYEEEYFQVENANKNDRLQILNKIFTKKHIKNIKLNEHRNEKVNKIIRKVERIDETKKDKFQMDNKSLNENQSWYNQNVKLEIPPDTIPEEHYDEDTTSAKGQDDKINKEIIIEKIEDIIETREQIVKLLSRIIDAKKQKKFPKADKKRFKKHHSKRVKNVTLKIPRKYPKISDKDVKFAENINKIKIEETDKIREMNETQEEQTLKDSHEFLKEDYSLNIKDIKLEIPEENVIENQITKQSAKKMEDAIKKNVEETGKVSETQEIDSSKYNQQSVETNINNNIQEISSKIFKEHFVKTVEKVDDVIKKSIGEIKETEIKEEIQATFSPKTDRILPYISELNQPFIVATHLVPSLPIELFEVLVEIIENFTERTVLLVYKSEKDQFPDKNHVDLAILPANADWKEGMLLPVSFVFEHHLNRNNSPYVYIDVIIKNDRILDIKDIKDLRGKSCAISNKYIMLHAAKSLFTQSENENLTFFDILAFFSDILVTKSHLAVMKAVIEQQTEIGILEAPVINYHKFTLCDAKSLHVFTSLGPLPPYRLMINNCLRDHKFVKPLISYLLNIKQHEIWMKSLSHYGVIGFSENSTNFYQPDDT